MYIIKRKFKCLSWIWLLFHLVKWKKHFFTSLDEIKVILTPSIWISSIYHIGDLHSVSSEPMLFAHMKRGGIHRLQTKVRLLAPLNGCTCVLEQWVYGVITKPCLFKYTENLTLKTENFQTKNSDIFSYFCSKHRLWVLVRTASARRF